VETQFLRSEPILEERERMNIHGQLQPFQMKPLRSLCWLEDDQKEWRVEQEGEDTLQDV